MAIYRLRQVDQNSQVTYSKTIYVNDKAADGGNISLFPNPMGRESNTIQLKRCAGRWDQLRKPEDKLTSPERMFHTGITGPNSVEPVTALQNGIYIVKVKDKTFKLIKQSWIKNPSKEGFLFNFMECFPSAPSYCPLRSRLFFVSVEIRNNPSKRQARCRGGYERGVSSL